MRKLLAATCIAAIAHFGSVAVAAAADVTIRAAHVFNTSFSSHLGMVDFAERVAEKTNGAVEVKIFPEGQLGNERELLEGATLGSHDISLTGAAGWAIINPKLGTFELPFLYRDMDHQRKVFNGELRSTVDQMFEEKGLKFLAYFAYGLRSTLTTDKPVDTLESFKGLKIRVPEVPIFVKTFEALGANPTPINFGEVYTALQSGVVQAVEGSPESMLAQKFTEVTKYFTLTQHQSPPILVAMNKAAFARLSPENQTALLEAAQEASDALFDKVVKANADAVEMMKVNGVEAVEVSDAEREKIKQAVQVVYDELGAQYESGELLGKIAEVQ
jgi:tripartite ATP-independent transporter DctP family solute receptor